MTSTSITPVWPRNTERRRRIGEQSGRALRRKSNRPALCLEPLRGADAVDGNPRQRRLRSGPRLPGRLAGHGHVARDGQRGPPRGHDGKRHDPEVDLFQDFRFSPSPSTLSFTLSDLTFDDLFDSGYLPDAFGVALVDPFTPQFLVTTVEGSADSYSSGTWSRESPRVAPRKVWW